MRVFYIKTEKKLKSHVIFKNSLEDDYVIITPEIINFYIDKAIKNKSKSFFLYDEKEEL